MARVKGIITAGLASATDFTQQQPAGAETTEAKAAATHLAEQRAARQARRETAGLPSDLLTAGTGALAGSVFGPLGALLVGGLAYNASKKRRERAFAFAEAEQAANSGSLERGRNALKMAREKAGDNQELLAELDLMQEEFEQYANLAENSPDGQARTQGLLNALAVSGQLDDEIEQFYEQGRNALQREQEIAQQQFGRYDNLRGNLEQDSARFRGAQETFQKAKLAYENPTPQSDMALIYLTAQSIDPGAIVTDGDSKMVKSTGSLSQQFAGILNSYLDGTAQFDDAVRDGLMAVIASNYLPLRQQQLERNGQYQELGQAAKLDGAFLENLQIKVDPTEAEEIAKFRAFTPTPLPPGDPSDNAFEKGVDALRRAFGNETYEADNGDEMMLIDRGNGRREWVNVSEAERREAKRIEKEEQRRREGRSTQLRNFNNALRREPRPTN